MSRFRLPAPVIAAFCLLLTAGVVLSASFAGASSTSGPVAARQATPASYSCDMSATPAATPAMDMSMGMDHGAGMTTLEFDQTYIDMMLPHHASVVALAEAALPRLENADLQTIAMTIISSQSAEVEELSALREQLYGSAMPEPMDVIMPAMAEYMPEAHDMMMADMAMMDSDALVAQFCAQTDADLAFIDLVIPHHESAISASEVAVTDAASPELRAFAERVITDQQAEIDEMRAIRATLTGDAAATPAA